MSAESRIEVRQRVFLKGRVIFNNGASSMDCLVRDMSPIGARLVLSESATLPDMFDLYIPQKERSFRATLRWRRLDGVGVAFADETAREAVKAAPQATPEPAGDASLTLLLRRIAELEAENAALRRLLAETAQTATGSAVGS